MINSNIGIVIPAYNAENTIERCVQSLLAQERFENLLVVIIDDGSTDNTSEKLKSYEIYGNINIIRQQNSGLSAARNSGIDFIYDRCDYISFLDSDDTLCDNFLVTIENIIFEQKPDIIEFNANRIVDGNSSKVERISRSDDRSHKIFEHFKFLNKNQKWFAWSRVYKKELFSEFRFHVGRRFEDRLLIPEIYAQSKAVFSSSKVLYNYFYVASSISNNPKFSDLKDIYYSLETYPFYMLTVEEKRLYEKRIVTTLLRLSGQIEERKFLVEFFSKILALGSVQVNIILFFYRIRGLLKKSYRLLNDKH